jgi:hypothetical protein
MARDRPSSPAVQGHGPRKVAAGTEPPSAKPPRRGEVNPRIAVWVTDLRDAVGLHGELAESRKGIGQFVAAIVEAATARPRGPWGKTVVRCTLRRPARSKCDGLAQVRLDNLDDVAWRCVVCGNQGVVRTWQDSAFDLRRARDARPRRQRTAVTLSVPEYEAIRDSLMMGADHAEILAAATPEEDGIGICAAPGELEALCDSVAAEANHAPTRRLQRLLDSTVERLRSTVEPAPPDRADSIRVVRDPLTEKAVADGIANMLGVAPGAQARYQGIFVETARAVLEAHALEQRIRQTARTADGKASLIQFIELGEVLDQAATFARSHPEDGVRVLSAFIDGLRGTTLTENLAPLVADAAKALLAAAKAARDSQVVRDAMRALVGAHIRDERFGDIATALDGARLGKRATKIALDEIASLGDSGGDEGRRRAFDLKSILAGRHLS